MSLNKLFVTDKKAPLNTPLDDRYKIAWPGLVALAFGGLNQSILLFQGLITNQGTMGLTLLAFGIIIIWAQLPGWIELVLMYPNKVGGIAACAADIFGKIAPPVGCLIGVSYWLAWGSTVSFGAIFTIMAIQEYFPFIPTIPAAILVVVMMLLLNLTGVKWTARVILVSTSIGLLLAFASVIIPIATGHVNWFTATKFDLTVPFAGFFGSYTSIMSGFYLVAFSAPAIEHALNYVRETKQPVKNVTKGAYITAVLAGLYYIILPLVWLGTLGPQRLNVDQAGLAHALIPTFVTTFINSGAAKFAAVVFVVTNSWIYTAAGLSGISRVLAQIAADGYAPAFFGKVNQYGAPWVALLASAGLGLTFVIVGAPTWLLAGTNLSYLISICSPSIAVWLLRRKEPNALRPYRASNLAINLGFVCVLFWTLTTIFGYQQYGLQPVIGGITFIYLALFFYVWRSLLDQRVARKSSLKATIFHTLHFKLTLTMMFVLSLDAGGYLVAVSQIPTTQSSTIVLLEDIFILVALLTLNVGLIIPSMIVRSVNEVTTSAKKLAYGSLSDFSKAMRALGSGNLEAATVKIDFLPVDVHTKDEIGEMAASFNEMQTEIKRSAVSLGKARDELNVAREKVNQSQAQLRQFNVKLEQEVLNRTQELEETNQNLRYEITERKRIEAEVADLNDKLVLSARSIGMAEIASAILHNIGNVLNSANVAIEIATENLQHLSLNKLKDVVRMIESNIQHIQAYLTEDAKGKLLIPYLNGFIEEKNKNVDLVLREIKSLRTSIHHIKDIIHAQQSIAGQKSGGIIDRLTLQDTFDTTLKLTGVSLKNMDITIHKDFNDETLIATDKTKLFQILVNLIQNAGESVMAADNTDKQIIFKVRTENDLIIFQVTDNGLGISKEDLTKIFSFGFTTKEKGHGIGLHSCALAAEEMGGSLFAESEGENKGATFILTLPNLIKTFPQSRPQHDFTTT